MFPLHELFHVQCECSLQNIQCFLHICMGSVMHIKSFYDTEGILHRERLMMAKGLSVKVKMQKVLFVQRIMFFVFTLYIRAIRSA